MMAKNVEVELAELQKIMAEMSPECCEIPECPRPVYLIFYNRRVCEKHWKQDGVEINLKEVFGIMDKKED